MTAHSFRVIAVIASALASSACTSVPALTTPVLATQANHLTIYGAQAYSDKRGMIVRGWVRRPVLDITPLWGHLHIAASFVDNRPPLAVDARWSTIPSRGIRSAPFFALLRTPQPAEIKSVRVEYRTERDDRRSHP